MKAPVLTVKDLKTYFYTRGGVARAVDGVSISVGENEVVGLVGESGCGKTVTALSVMRLVPSPGKIVGGRILYRGKNLLELSDQEIRAIRGDRISMIFQDPMTFLNPVYKIGEQIEEAIFLHRNIPGKEIRERTLEILRKVRMPDPGRRFDDYPHQFSGGMRQRVMIAMAMACDPHLLIADEPVTALDVTIQAQILELLHTMKENLRTSILLITHDMSVVAETCDRVCVMYAGRVVEEAPVGDLFEFPIHPYTKGLMSCIPRADIKIDHLYAIKGSVPDLLTLGKGCGFSPRCDFATERCHREIPSMTKVEQDHYVSCFLHE